MKSKRSVRKTRREKKKIKKKTIVLFSTITVIIASFFYTMNHDYFAIKSVRIEGQKTLIESDIKKSIDTYFDTSTMRLIRKDNILIVQTQRIQDFLGVSFPKIDDISVEIMNGDELVVTIGERSAHSLWCVDRDYESVFDEECYFADRAGLIYASAPYFSGNIYKKLFIQSREEELYIGTVVDNTESFDGFFVFLSELEEQYPISISNVYFDDFNDVRVEINRLKNITYNDPKPQLFFNQSDNYELILRNIGITLDFETFKNDFKNQAKNLSLIDVRFDGRIFYSFRPIDSESE
ncbi:MAG: hypothetical protein ACI870_000412 [Crocinitomicaceae bacterium]